jgi:hypothetical protein
MAYDNALCKKCHHPILEDQAMYKATASAVEVTLSARRSKTSFKFILSLYMNYYWSSAVWCGVVEWATKPRPNETLLR